MASQNPASETGTDVVDLTTPKQGGAQRVDRLCDHPECTTKLSRYNPDPSCQTHGGWSDASVSRPGRKPNRTEDHPPVMAPQPPEPDTTSSAMADITIDGSLDDVALRQMLRRIGDLLVRSSLQVVPRPSGLVVSGDPSAILLALERVQRLAARQGEQVVTTVRFVARTTPRSGRSGGRDPRP
ncbi:hypothetical protein BH23ACT9_BH23ACT9_24570 [soil metagenome]